MVLFTFPPLLLSSCSGLQMEFQCSHFLYIESLSSLMRHLWVSIPVSGFLQKEDGQSVFGGEEESWGPPATHQGGEDKGPLPGNGSGGGDKKIPGNGGRAGKISSSNHLTGKLKLLFSYLFYIQHNSPYTIINAKLSQQRFWQCQQEQSYRDNSSVAPQPITVSIKSGFLYRGSGLTWISRNPC